MSAKRLRLLILALGLCGLPVAAVPAQPGDSYISIIIDDLGNQWSSGQRALDISDRLTFAILPHTPYSVRLATLAHERGQEVMLHLPMASVHPRHPGPGAVNLSMSRQAFLDQVNTDLDSVPYISGVNNHMGSQVTPSTRHMEWLMQDLEQRGGLFFVDSRTTADSVAMFVARENGLPTVKRDVFLDNDRDPEAIHKQFQRLLRLSRQHGWAVAIGHPHPQTLALLEAELPKLEGSGIHLVPVSRLIHQLKQRGPVLWQASLSPSPQDSKN
jgi:polysaccharide deacetylase 2 family uncharacterized protein YibQ